MKTKTICLMVLLYCTSAFACRPLTTDDCGTVEKGKFEIENGLDGVNLFSGGNSHSAGPSIKHGITESMDIGVSIPFALAPAVDEISGAAVFSLKFGFIKNLLAVSISGSPASAAYSLNSVFSKDFGSFNTHLNLGYNATGDPAAKGLLTYGLSVLVPVDKFQIVMETYGDEQDKNWLVGGIYELFPGFSLDAGYTRSFTTDTDRMTAGFHAEF